MIRRKHNSKTVKMVKRKLFVMMVPKVSLAPTFSSKSSIEHRKKQRILQVVVALERPHTQYKQAIITKRKTQKRRKSSIKS